MLLGQLYYYNGKINEIPLELNEQNLNKVELLGLPPLNSFNYRGLSSYDIFQKIKGEFADGFANELKQNGLYSVLGVWSYINSPFVNKESSGQTSSYQSRVIDWVANGSNLNNLDEIIKDGLIDAQSEEDFAIYYGLKIIKLFTKKLVIPKFSLDLQFDKNKFDDTISVSQKPSILVVTNELEAPLFANLNCDYVLISESESDNLTNVQSKLDQSNGISLVLVACRHSSGMVKLLEKKLITQALITNIDLSITQKEDNFFDTIARKTLGYRL